MNSGEILFVVCVSIAFVVDVILVAYYIIKRTRKGAQCPAVVEYDIHQLPDPDPEDSAQEKEEVNVIFVYNRAEVKPDQGTGCGEDYDKLWSVDRLQRDNGPTSAYSHMVPTNNACVSTDDNPYDSAALSYCDRRPINNLYEKMFMSEN